jgi:D-Tyr-tRNA(Tyr) deacylase
MSTSSSSSSSSSGGGGGGGTTAAGDCCCSSAGGGPTTTTVFSAQGAKATTAVASATNTAPSSVHMVIQRFRQCKILLREREWVTVGRSKSRCDASNDEKAEQQQHRSHCGLLVYVSFAVHTNHAAMERAAQTIMNLPVLTLGLWGDGTDTQTSLVQLMIAQQQQAQQAQQDPSSIATSPAPTCSIIICPQANLIAKVKSHGKSIQYHGQIDKSQGRECYQYFCDCLRAHILEQHYPASSSSSCLLPPSSYTRWKRQHPTAITSSSSSSSTFTATSPVAPANTAATVTMMLDPSIPPHQMFASDRRYTSWDADGLPTMLAETGGALTKSARKKLVKLQQAHAKRHEKWLVLQQQQQQQQQQQHESASHSSETTAAADVAAKTVLEEEEKDASTTPCNSRRRARDSAAAAAVTATAHAPPDDKEGNNDDDDDDDESWKQLPVAGCCFATTSRTTTSDGDCIPQQSSSSTPITTTTATPTGGGAGAGAGAAGAGAGACCQLIQGSFGMRQGLELYSDMGPFCHVLQI